MPVSDDSGRHNQEEQEGRGGVNEIHGHTDGRRHAQIVQLARFHRGDAVCELEQQPGDSDHLPAADGKEEENDRPSSSVNGPRKSSAGGEHREVRPCVARAKARPSAPRAE